MLGLPFNPGCINRNHTHGTHAPVEEPSTASIADIRHTTRHCAYDRNSFIVPHKSPRVPKPRLREWIMPAIVTATVVRWEVNQDSLKTIEPFVEFVDAKNITLYVEGSEDTEASALIAEYIESAPDDEKKKLLEAARVGLLQVVGVTRCQ
jgi:hypothetical protein